MTARSKKLEDIAAAISTGIQKKLQERILEGAVYTQAQATEFVRQSLDKMAKATNTHMSLEETPPEEEAAERLAGDFDPAKLKITIRQQLPADFVKITFVVDEREG